MTKSSTVPQCEPRRIPERVFRCIYNIEKSGLAKLKFRKQVIALSPFFDYWVMVWLSKYCGEETPINFGYVILTYDEWKVRQ